VPHQTFRSPRVRRQIDLLARPGTETRSFRRQVVGVSIRTARYPVRWLPIFPGELTQGLQNSVNAAQEANVDIAKARAEAETAKQTAAANRQLAASLKKSPELKQVRVAELYSKACIAARNCTLVQGGGALVQTGK
jgi:regulator of protease activity HflC (stomatin/prohibitin superfamily)